MAACNDYYEPFKGFHEKIKNACECIGENGHETVAGEVEAIKSSISNLDVSGYWDDAVGQDFITVKESFVSSLETVLSSINGTWSTSEGLYQSLDQELQNLSDTQNAYIEFWGTKPQENDYKETVIAVDKSGNETSHTITMPEYWRKLAEWNNQNADYLTKFQGIIDSIKSLAEQLTSLGSERVSIGDLGTIGGLSSIVTTFSSNFVSNNLGNFDSENFEGYTLGNGDKYIVLKTDVGYDELNKTLTHQAPDQCHVWSDKYANAIVNHSRFKDHDLGSYTPYTTKDESKMLKFMASELADGRPPVIQVANGSGRHFVTVVGIKESADLSNLKQSDFLIMDPASTKVGSRIRPLNTEYKGTTVRRLQTGKESGNGRTYDYLILAYNSNYEDDGVKITEVW